jgi:hypothetical protein
MHDEIGIKSKRRNLKITKLYLQQQNIKCANQSWYILINPLSYIAPSVLTLDWTGTTFTTQRGSLIKTDANPPKLPHSYHYLSHHMQI